MCGVPLYPPLQLLRITIKNTVCRCTYMRIYSCVICIFIYICIYMRMYVYICVCMYIYPLQLLRITIKNVVRKYISIDMYTYIYVYIYIYIHIYVFLLGVTSTVYAFSRGLANTISDNVNSMVNRGSSPSQIRNAKNKNNYNKKMNFKNSKKNSNKKNSNSNYFTNFFTSMTNYGSNNHPKNPNYRGRNIDPWRPFWQSLTFSSKSKTESKKFKFDILEKFNSLNRNENINNRLGLYEY
jgi:hypothetical protein